MNSQNFVGYEGKDLREIFPECDACGKEAKTQLYIRTSDGIDHHVCPDCIWDALIHISTHTKRCDSDE